MTKESVVQNNKALVRSFYEGGTVQTSGSYGDIFDPDFTVTAPKYLPWGGTSPLPHYLKQILPQVTALLDFSRCRIISLIGEENLVAIVVEISLQGNPDSILISEHWNIRNGKAVSLWVAYFDAGELMNMIKQQSASG